MKATIIVLAVLCLVLGGIAGWALRSVTARSGPTAMVDITPRSPDNWGSSRIAIYDGGTLTVADYNPAADGGSVEHVHRLKIK